jgi:death-on-curing protein
MTEPRWIPESAVLAIHDQQIATHGGLNGTRDRGVIQSALARPAHIWHYESQDIAVLAAAYAYGLSKNHGFNDGNKRVAFVVAKTFLILNGHDLHADDAEIVRVMLAVADGTMAEAALAEWIRGLLVGIG